MITSLERSTPQGWVKDSVARAGDVVRIRGLGAARTGSWVGKAIPGRVTRQFPLPRLNPWSIRSTRSCAARCSPRCGNWLTLTR